MSEQCEIILASASSARRQMLTAAGVPVTVKPARVDEDAIRDALSGENCDVDAADVAEVLARAKAEAVSATNPQAVVIGADQILALDREIFTKPHDRDQARETLQRLSGTTHQLHSAVAIAQGGEVIWAHVESAQLTMRDLSPKYLAYYLANAGPGILHSVGAYELEGLGAQLFQSVEGDYFTVLGLPLLATLKQLRVLGCLLT